MTSDVFKTGTEAEMQRGGRCTKEKLANMDRLQV